jgi:hypothetical protein
MADILSEETLRIFIHICICIWIFINIFFDIVVYKHTNKWIFTLNTYISIYVYGWFAVRRNGMYVYSYVCYIYLYNYLRINLCICVYLHWIPGYVKYIYVIICGYIYAYMHIFTYNSCMYIYIYVMADTLSEKTVRTLICTYICVYLYI